MNNSRPEYKVADDLMNPSKEQLELQGATTTKAKPKILILGHGGHGKDTVAAMLAKLTGMKFTSSSRAALDVIYPTLKEIYGNTDKMWYFNMRRSHRLLWKELISLYNTPDKAALTKHILKDNDIYVGMRSLDEYEASKDLFDHIIYVDAFTRLGEDGIDPSMEIPYEEFKHITVWNNKSLEHTEEQLKTIVVHKRL